MTSFLKSASLFRAITARSTLLAVSTSLFTFSALAQSDESNSGGISSLIEEIVVTSRKYEESHKFSGATVQCCKTLQCINDVKNKRIHQKMCICT